jgi:AcrR family transcriptional regulator
MAKTVAPRPLRVDAQRNIDSLIESAKALFLSSGVDVPMKEIADRAGVGVGTLYRHFPLRSDLISAVFKREIDGCAAAAPLLATSHPPDAALELWLQTYTGFVATKHGLAAALHSGDPAYSTLRVRFEEQRSRGWLGARRRRPLGATGRGRQPLYPSARFDRQLACLSNGCPHGEGPPIRRRGVALHGMGSRLEAWDSIRQLRGRQWRPVQRHSSTASGIDRPPHAQGSSSTTRGLLSRRPIAVARRCDQPGCAMRQTAQRGPTKMKSDFTRTSKTPPK